MVRRAALLISNVTAALVGAVSCIIIQRCIEKHDDHQKHNITTSFKTETSQSSAQVVKLPITTLSPNPNLHIVYDTIRKNPLYVVENIRGGYQQSALNNTSIKRASKSFREEKSLDEQHRSRNSHFRQSGFDRGHIAPAANFKDSDKVMNDTFTLCNVSPQSPTFNRKIWSRLELLVHKLARKMEEELSSKGCNIADINTTVITGPLWLPSKIITSPSSSQHSRDLFEYNFVGFGHLPSIIQVPTHFFKVIATVYTKNEEEKFIRFASFVIPNESFDGYESLNLEDYLVGLSDLESYSGLSFFPHWTKMLSSRSGNRIEIGDDYNIGAEYQFKDYADSLTDDLWKENRGKLDKTDNPVLRSSTVRKISKKKKKNIRSLVRKISSSLIIEHHCRNRACREIIYLSKKV